MVITEDKSSYSDVSEGIHRWKLCCPSEMCLNHFK